MTLTFFTHPRSRSRSARWMLEEIGAPYESVVIDFDKKPAALLEANPLGKVPVIVHDGQVVSEAAAICAYLAEAFPEAALAPRGDERAAYYRWLFFTSGPLESAMVDKALGVQVPPEREGMVGYASFARALERVDRARWRSAITSRATASPRRTCSSAARWASSPASACWSHARPSWPISTVSVPARPGSAPTTSTTRC
jgi:glutathione S-transferase